MRRLREAFTDGAADDSLEILFDKARRRRKLEFPSSDKVLKKTGVRTIKEYIQKRRGTIMKYAMTRNV